MKISGKQVAAARELLGLNQSELAEAIGLNMMTISRFEAGLVEPYTKNLDRIREELERRGIEFTNRDGVGVRLNYAKAAAYAASQNRSLQ